MAAPSLASSPGLAELMLQRDRDFGDSKNHKTTLKYISCLRFKHHPWPWLSSVEEYKHIARDPPAGEVNSANITELFDMATLIADHFNIVSCFLTSRKRKSDGTLYSESTIGMARSALVYLFGLSGHKLSD